MLLILLEWLFTLACLVPVGVFVLDRLPGARVQAEPLHALLLGLITVTVTATLWNFFLPVGFFFQLALALLSLLLIVAQRRRLQQLLGDLHARWKAAHPWVRVAGVLLVLIALVKSASPSEVLDEGGYYLPYIRWIETYRVVPGIANIEDRLGFNSAFHMASAVFGLRLLSPGGLYDLNGLLLIGVGAWFLGGVNDLLRKRPLTASGLMKVFCLFFLMRNVLTAPAADLSNMLFGEVMLVLLMERIEQGRTTAADQGVYLLIAYGLFVTTIKFSSLLLLLGPGYLFVRMLLARVRVNVLVPALMAMLLLVPWCMRSYYLSGYLIYPLHQIDLFAPDWKVPKATAERQYHYVAEFAKTNAKPGDSTALAQRSVAQWAPAWFKRENAFNKAMAIAVVLGTIGLLVVAWSRRRAPWDVDRIAYVLFLWLLLAVWFLYDPAFRFGWAWIIVFVAFAFHALLGRVAEGRWARWVALGLFAAFTLQNTAKTAREDHRCSFNT